MLVRGAELLCASVPRLNASFTRDTIARAIHEAVTKLGYSRANGDQVVAIREFVLLQDVFVMLLTVFHVHSTRIHGKRGILDQTL